MIHPLAEIHLSHPLYFRCYLIEKIKAPFHLSFKSLCFAIDSLRVEYYIVVPTLVLKCYFWNRVS